MSGHRKLQELRVVDSHDDRIFRGALSLTKDKHLLQEAEVVNAYYERIFRAALSLTWDRHLAEEIVQETFLSAFKKLDSFSGRSSLFTWIYRIMLNKYRDHCREKSLLRRLGFVRAVINPTLTKTVSSADPSPAAQLTISEERQLLKNEVDKLPAKLRVVVTMHYFDDLPLKQIAEILNSRLGTVKFRLFDARKRLYQALQGKLKDAYENAVRTS